MRVVLSGDLLGIGKNGLEIIGQLHGGHAGVTRLLHDTGHNLTGLAGKVTQNALIISIAQALHDDGTRGGLCNASEVLGGVIEFADGVALFVFFGGHNGHATRALIDLNSSLCNCAGDVVVRLQQCLFDGINKGIERYPFLMFDHSQGGHIDFHSVPHSHEPKSTRERAFLISSYAIVWLSAPVSTVAPLSSALLTRPTNLSPFRILTLTNPPI